MLVRKRDRSTVLVREEKHLRFDQPRPEERAGGDTDLWLGAAAFRRADAGGRPRPQRANRCSPSHESALGGAARAGFAPLAGPLRGWCPAGEYERFDRAACAGDSRDGAGLGSPASRVDRLDGDVGWRSQYPAAVDFELRDLRGAGGLWVAEVSIRYDGGPWQLGVSILEFRGDHVARETIYVTEPWKAPEWRAPWRAAP